MTDRLDPMPYSCSESNTGRDKYAAGHNTFNPRAGYSQDEADYA